MIYPFDKEYEPAIPLLPVRLHALDSGSTTEQLHGIVDTGADGTVVPIAHLKTIQAVAEAQQGLRSQWGERRLVDLYLVDVKIGEVALQSIWVVGDTLSDELILGRNILNQLRLLMDGPEKYSTLDPTR